MKRVLKIAGYSVLSILFILYLSFLFILPKSVDLNKYKPDLQKAVKDNTGLTLDFDRVEVITSPFLEAGIRTKNIKVKFPDNTELFSADAFKAKVFLPELLWLTVRVSCAEVDSPKANIEIINSEKYKVAKIYEDLINKKREQRRLNPPEQLSDEADMLPFDISSIKLYIPSLKLNNYKITIDDVKTSHKLALTGDLFEVGYYNGETAKLKTNSRLLSDDNTNITANLDIKTFIPEFRPEQQVDDDEAVFELPFVNPVTEFRNYNLKSDINSKLRIKKDKKTDKIWAKGFLNIDNTSVTLAGLQLPDSYFNLMASGYYADIDTNFYVTDKEFMNFLGKINYGSKPYIDCSFKSTQIHFDNLLKIARAYLDTVHIKNDIGNMTASGYLYSNFRFKTDFDNIESDGKFIIRDGNIYDKNIGLLLRDVVANIIFDDNNLTVEKTHMLVDNNALDISGTIDSKSNSTVNIAAERIPLKGLYLAFAPRDIKRAYKLTSGFLSINAKLRGTIKNTSSILKANLEDLVVSDAKGNFTLKNDSSRFNIANSSGVILGKFQNEGFRFDIPATKSEVFNPLLIANLDNSDIQIQKSDIHVNRKSKISFDGIVKNYLSGPDTKIFASGNLDTGDIKTLLGDAVAPYLCAKGAIPVKLAFDSKGQKMKLRVQMQSNKDAYITPVNFKELEGQSMLFQLLAEKSGNTAKIYRSGLYLRKPDASFRDNLHLNLIGIKEIAGLRAIFTNLNTDPFISLFKLNIPKELNGSICIFPQSKFVFGGNAYMFGNLMNPKINGKFNVRMLEIPELYTRIRDIALDLANRDIRLSVNDVSANGSDFVVKVKTNWKLISESKIADLKISSRLIDADKIISVSDALTKTLASCQSRAGIVSSGPSDIPVRLLGGNINLRQIKSGNILVNNTTGRLSLYNNVLYLNNLKTSPMGGKVSGNASMNLVTNELNLKATGKNFDINKMLVDAMNMKDTLSGEMNFIADISMRGLAYEEQMKSLKGYIDFNVKEGQLGPFGKFENFLMAENIRNNAFFSSAIGSVITNIVTIDTSRFNNLYGHLTFNDGIANVSPIKSQGNVMSMYIAGDVGLIDNSADLKLRGKLASAFSDSLGPLANVNPVNLIKNSPGLNVVAAKTFSIFCESVSEEEMNALPSLAENKSDDYATKFQIVLRGDTRKPLKMIKSFKWLALQSDIEAAQDFVDTIPVPEAGEENLSVEELIQKRLEQAEAQKSGKKTVEVQTPKKKTFKDKLKSIFKKDSEEN